MLNTFNREKAGDIAAAIKFQREDYIRLIDEIIENRLVFSKIKNNIKRLEEEFFDYYINDCQKLFYIFSVKAPLACMVMLASNIRDKLISYDFAGKTYPHKTNTRKNGISSIISASLSGKKHIRNFLENGINASDIFEALETSKVSDKENKKIYDRFMENGVVLLKDAYENMDLSVPIIHKDNIMIGTTVDYEVNKFKKKIKGMFGDRVRAIVYETYPFESGRVLRYADQADSSFFEIVDKYTDTLPDYKNRNKKNSWVVLENRDKRVIVLSSQNCKIRSEGGSCVSKMSLDGSVISDCGYYVLDGLEICFDINNPSRTFNHIVYLVL